MQGLLFCQAAFHQPTGLIVSFAPYSKTESDSGFTVINIPAYLLERLDEEPVVG